MTAEHWTGKRIQRNEAVQTASLGDEVAMMHIRTGKYYLLNPIGTRIWECLEEPSEFEAIVDSLTAVFDVSRDACSRDTGNFIRDMVEKEILKVI